MKITDDKLLIGRNEWCSLSELNLPFIKAKIDTGAKTSSLHAFNIKCKKIEDQKWVYFDIHPLQSNDELIVSCQAQVFDERNIMSSNGHYEKRYIIKTPIKINESVWNIEVSLSNRDPLRFRMLLGREALCKRVLIDPNISCNQLKKSNHEILLAYKK